MIPQRTAALFLILAAAGERVPADGASNHGVYRRMCTPKK